MVDHECAACGKTFNPNKEGIIYIGREGKVSMCEEHMPAEFKDDGMVGMSEDDQYEDAFSDVEWNDAHEESRCPYCDDNHCGGWCG